MSSKAQVKYIPYNAEHSQNDTLVDENTYDFIFVSRDFKKILSYRKPILIAPIKPVFLQNGYLDQTSLLNPSH